MKKHIFSSSSFIPKSFRAFAYTSPGLEKYLGLELSKLCNKNINVIHNEGCDLSIISEPELWKICSYSRLISGIRLRIGLVKDISKFNVFDRHIRNLPWDYFLPLKNITGHQVSYKFHSTCHNSKLYHSNAISQRVSDYLTKKKLLKHFSSNKEEEIHLLNNIAHKYPHIQDINTIQYYKDPISMHFHMRIVDNLTQISIDPSGNLLSRRGYRKYSIDAPIRENFAATCLDIINYKGEYLWDPFCGSGTLICEALLRYISTIYPNEIAFNQLTNPPRDYAYTHWNNFSDNAYNKWIKDNINPSRTKFYNFISQSNNNKFYFLGSDISEYSTNIAYKNWRILTGFKTINDNSFIDFKSGDFENIAKNIKSIFPEPPIIFSNIPYGHRLSKHLNSIYNRFNRMVRDNPELYSDVYIIDGSEKNHFLSIASSNNVSWTSLAQFSNGGIGVKLLKLKKK